MEVIGHRRGAVDVGRGAVELGDGGEIDGFAVEVGAGVVELVHGRGGLEKTSQRSDARGFPLEKTTSNFVSARVLRAWLNFLPRWGSRREYHPELRGRFRNPQFVSFMAQNNRRRVKYHLKLKIMN